MTMQFETGAKTLRDLASWILNQIEEIQELRLYTHDQEYGAEPWHGIVEVNPVQHTQIREGVTQMCEAYAIISDSFTEAEFAAQQEKIMQQAQDRHRRSWNRPEVLEAKRRGLLP